MKPLSLVTYITNIHYDIVDAVAVTDADVVVHDDEYDENDKNISQYIHTYAHKYYYNKCICEYEPKNIMSCILKTMSTYEMLFFLQYFPFSL